MSLSLKRYEQVDAALTRCGSVREMYEFCIYAFKSIQQVVPFDHGRVCFLDDRAHVFDERLFGSKEELSQEYYSIYANLDDGEYSITWRSLERRFAIRQHSSHSPYEIYAHDWEEEPHDTRFYKEYVSRLGVRYSSGIALYDTNDRVRGLLVFERFEKSGQFTDEEREVLSVLNKHLDNLFRNFFVNPPITHGDTIALLQSGYKFTRRELDIAKLLLVGFPPKRIAAKLGISRTTVYKHVSNIHDKLGVSNQLELISKLRELIAAGLIESPQDSYVQGDELP